MDIRTALSTFACLLTILGAPAFAQDSDVDASATDVSAEGDDVADEDLLGEDELQTLVAPVALFPDTLLVQVLVAATAPLDVIKADRLVDEHPESEAEDLQALIDEEDWDESVGVLATAFPDVLSDMADNVEWTESMGTAMLAQSDDVLDAIQVLRQDAVETGALETGEEQTVEVSNDNTVVIQPTDPQVVYVPQYVPQQVFPETYARTDPYFYDNWDVGDTIMTGALAWGTFALIDDIFDDDDHWHDYWGCHNCGGWDGGPIIRDPDIDIDVDGNVNIGNRVNIDRDKVKNNIDRDKIKGEWNPDSKKRQDARNKIKKERKANGDSKMHLDKSKSRGDKVRENISKGGDRDLAAAVNRPQKPGNGGGGNRPNVNRPGGGDGGGANRPGGGGNGNRPGKGDGLNRPGGGDNAGLNRPGGGDKAKPSTRPAQKPKPKIDRAKSDRPKTGAANSIKRNSGGDKPNIKKASASKPAVKKPAAKPAAVKKPAAKPAAKPAVKKPAAVSRPASKPAVKKPTSIKRPSSASRPAMQKSHSSRVTRASSSRGHASRGGGHKRR